jgi:biopolymer transport protein ExbD
MQWDLKVVALNRIYSGLTEPTLRTWIREARVSPQDLVRQTGNQSWLALKYVQELARELPAHLQPQPEGIEELVPSGVEAEVQAAEEQAAGGRRRKLRRRPLEDSSMDMTPMIDVTFQLLIFFMLTNSLAQSASIEVPQARYGRGVSPEGRQYVLVDQQGQYYLGEIPTDAARAENLDKLIEEVTGNAAHSDQPLPVIVNAHKKTQHKYIRELLERLKKVDHLGEVLVGVEELR